MYWAFPYFQQLLPQHLQERLQEALVRPHYRATANEQLVISNIQTGEVLKEFNYPNAIRVNRAGMRKLVVDGIDVAVCYPLRLQKGGIVTSVAKEHHLLTGVQYDHELSRIEYTETGVIAHFTDGTSEAGTTLVGADGGNSFVRRLLLGERGEPETFPQYEMVNLSVKYTAEQAKYIEENMAPYVDYGVHPKGIFFMLLCKTAANPETCRKQ